MTDIFGRVGCGTNSSRRLLSGMAGAGVAYSGLDQLLVPFGAPRELHWALAGVATDLSCRGVGSVIDPLMESGMSALAGFAGAKIAQMVLPQFL